MTRALDGSVVAVIGASGGLGTPISRKLAERGARLVLAGPHADRLAVSARALGTDVLTVPLDLRDSTAGDRLVSAVSERHGRLDGVVIAAGVVAFGDLVGTDDVMIEELFLTNVLGPLWLVRRVVAPLAASKGFVVGISGVVAEQPLPGLAAYSASKAAASAAFRALTRELRRSGIQVCDVRPPHTETGLATRPIAGTAPRFPTGLDPEAVASRIVRAVEEGESEVPASSFG